MDATATLPEVDPVTLLSFDESLVFNNCTNNQGGNCNTYNNYTLANAERDVFMKRISQIEEEIRELKTKTT